MLEMWVIFQHKFSCNITVKGEKNLNWNWSFANIHPASRFRHPEKTVGSLSRERNLKAISDCKFVSELCVPVCMCVRERCVIPRILSSPPPSTAHQQLRLSTVFSFFFHREKKTQNLFCLNYGKERGFRMILSYEILASSDVKTPFFFSNGSLCSGTSVKAGTWVCVSGFVSVCVGICAYKSVGVCGVCVCSVNTLQLWRSRKQSFPEFSTIWLLTGIVPEFTQSCAWCLEIGSPWPRPPQLELSTPWSQRPLEPRALPHLWWSQCHCHFQSHRLLPKTKQHWGPHETQLLIPWRGCLFPCDCAVPTAVHKI